MEYSDIVERTHKVLEAIRKLDETHHYFNHISDELALSQAEKLRKHPQGKLAGIYVSVKDNICVKGIPSRAGSAILDGYRPLFNATAVQRAIDEGAIIIGKTSQDEFGFGTFSANTGKGFSHPVNPFDRARAAGGSSGGSAGITALADFPHISLAESTGGSIAAPASFCGVVGLTPTYGRVSRYGLIDYASSLDKIGPMAKTVEEAALMLEVISGHDSQESTSIDAPVDRYRESIGEPISGMRIGVIKEAFGKGVMPEVEEHVRRGISRLQDAGAEVREISLPFISKHCISTYYILAMCEASTNLAKFCGMRYGASGPMDGNFNQYFSRVRSENLGEEAKRRIILGTFARMSGFRDAYYMKAMKVRTLIINEYRKAFKGLDALCCPTMPLPPPRFSEIRELTPLQNYMMDIMTVGPNLAGLPHISVNAGHVGKLPVGMMLIADHLEERKLIRLGSVLQ